MMTSLRALAGAIFAVLMVAGCAGGESSNDRSFSELLEWIPDARATEEYVLLVNLANLRRTGGVSLPEDGTELEQLVAYQDDLRAASGRAEFNPQILGQDILDERSHENFTAYLHFSYADVDLSAEAGEPPDILFLAGGRFDAEAARTTLLQCDECFEPTDQYDHHGVEYYGWGTPYEQHLRERFSPPLYDGLGRGGRLFISDEMAVRTQDDRLMEAAIAAARLDGQRSLADIEDFELAADALQNENAWLAVLTRTTLGPAYWERLGDFVIDYVDRETAERFDEQWNPSAETPVLTEHQLFAAGTVADPEDPYLVVILVHANADDAERSVEPLRRRIDELDSATSGEPWRDIITSAEIEVDGRLLIARLHGLDFWTFWNDGDPLTLHD